MLVYYFKDVKFFKTFLESGKDYIVTMLCKRLTLVRYGDSELLFKKGDAPKLFYIVVKGCVNIYLNKDRYLGEARVHLDPYDEELNKKILKEYCNKIKDKYGGVDFFNLLNDGFFFDSHTYDFKHHLAAQVQAGNSFGELAVIRSAPRAASAITN